MKCLTRLANTGINQPWSQYEKTIYFRDYDITSLIQPGVNCVGVMLANAFWHNPNPSAGRYNKDGPQREVDEPLLLCAEVILEQQDGLAPEGLGDWCDYGHGQSMGASRFTPTQLSATATWALCALAVSRAAEVLDRPAEAQEYRDLHTRITADFQRHFRDPSSGKLRNLGSPQCANAMALCAEVVPPADRTMLIEELEARRHRAPAWPADQRGRHVRIARRLPAEPLADRQGDVSPGSGDPRGREHNGHSALRQCPATRTGHQEITEPYTAAH